jgi:hypothetical protein
MKNILFFSMTLFLFMEVINGQDLIVRNIGDTIKCTVTKIDSNIVYYQIRFHDRLINLTIDRNEIQDLIVPVLPDDPRRLLYEKKIKKYTPILLASGFSFVFGGAMIITGLKQSFEKIDGVYYFRGDYENQQNAEKKIALGIPFTVAGIVVGSIFFTKVIKYKKQLKNLNNLSINTDYSPIYNGFTICYKF